jgi:hypothetical protein
MPDPNRLTVSATQAPALFNASPYVTRWMLYHFFKGAPIEGVTTARMAWGLKMQPLLLAQASEDLKLEVEPTHDYVASKTEPLGYTADAFVHCPDRGPGTIETKCVFDYGVWARDWDSGKRVPRHYDLQLQQQLAVGDGSTPFKWGVIAAWVGAEMHYFERQYDPQVHGALRAAASEMLDQVAHNREPEPFGSSVESPLLAALFPVVKGTVYDLREHKDGQKWADLALAYEGYGREASFYDKARESARDELRAMAQSCEEVWLPGGIKLKLVTRTVKEHTRKASTSTTLKVEKTGEANVERSDGP